MKKAEQDIMDEGVDHELFRLPLLNPIFQNVFYFCDFFPENRLQFSSALQTLSSLFVSSVS